MEKPLVIVLCGPTASGKTACAVEVAKLLHGEVISADSMQIYRGMDIGTAKPDAAEMGGVAHHMLSIIDPWESFSAAAYGQAVKPLLAQMHARGVVPVLCGGTGLYINAAIQPMGFSAQGDARVRAELEEIAAQPEGRVRLHEMLERVDPDSAARLHVNDQRRVIRALEVYRLTGRTLTEQIRLDMQNESKYDARMFALSWPREALYERIDRRVDQMMQNGLEEEARALLKLNLPEGATAMQAIGYKEIIQALNGQTDMQSAVEAIKQGSRHYAKRQITWFKRDRRVQWIEAQGRSLTDISREIACRALKKQPDKPC